MTILVNPHEPDDAAFKRDSAARWATVAIGAALIVVPALFGAR